MTFQFSYSKRSQPEIQAAYDYYEEQQKGLGERFLSVLDNVFERITEYPFSFPKRKGGFRECYLGQFPFLIIYKVKGQNIYIYAVFHTSRNPRKKK